jgi:hypothetical protein
LKLNITEQLVLKSIFYTLPTYQAKKDFRMGELVSLAHKNSKVDIGIGRFNQLSTTLCRKFGITRAKMRMIAQVDMERRPYLVDAGLWGILPEGAKQVILLMEDVQKDAIRGFKGPLIQKAIRLLLSDQLKMSKGTLKTWLSRIKTDAQKVGSKIPAALKSLTNSTQLKPQQTRRGARNTSTRWKRKKKANA